RAHGTGSTRFRRYHDGSPTTPCCRPLGGSRMTGMIPIARPMIGAEERAAVDRVLAGGMLAAGPEVAAFEAEFAAIVGDRHCVAVNSGTSALLAGLLAAGVGPGDEV